MKKADSVMIKSHSVSGIMIIEFLNLFLLF